MLLNKDDIKQEKPNGGPILNFNKRLYRQYLSKFGTHVKKTMVLKTLKKRNSVSFLEIKLSAENYPKTLTTS